MSDQSQIDYLLIGHVTYDQSPEGRTAGGTVTFAAHAARALGYRPAILTSAGTDFVVAEHLPDIPVHLLPAQQTTTFRNVYTENGRQQQVFNQAAPIGRQHVPVAWQRAPLVHLAPVIGELELEMVELFSNSWLGVTPQGWLRRLSEDGRVQAADWPEADWPAARQLFRLAAAVILSEEDLVDDTVLERYRQWATLLVLTRGAAGCTIFWRDEARDIPAPQVVERQPTGAGDIFAAAFLIRLHQTGGDPWEAARFATRVAAESVTQLDLSGKMTAIRTAVNQYNAS